MTGRYEVLNIISGKTTRYDRYDWAKHRAECLGDSIIFDVLSNNRVLLVCNNIKNNAEDLREVRYTTEITTGGTVTQTVPGYKLPQTVETGL